MKVISLGYTSSLLVSKVNDLSKINPCNTEDIIKSW